MPTIPKRKCIECDAIAVANGRCARHNAEYLRRYRQSGARRESAALYNTAAWQALRREVLFECPFCVKCMEKGMYVPAQVVDHIDPHKGDEKKFFDKSNLQSLCKKCHDVKTASEDGGFGHAGG